MNLDDKEERSVEGALDTYLRLPAAAGLPSEVLPLARQLSALPVYVDIGGAILIRPDGTVLEVHSNQSWEGGVESRSLTEPRDLLLARVAASRTWPTLASLAPERPADATDCKTCEGAGQLVLGDLQAYCRECGGTGWRAPETG